MSDSISPDVEKADRWWEQRAEASGVWAEQIDPADLKPADTRALQAIARLTDLRKEIDAAILEAVREARRDRRTWAEIGAMLGVTRQGAQHKYAPALARTQSEPRTQRKDDPTVSDSYDRQPHPDAARLVAHLHDECLTSAAPPSDWSTVVQNYENTVRPECFWMSLAWLTSKFEKTIQLDPDAAEAIMSAAMAITSELPTTGSQLVSDDRNQLHD